MTYRKWVGTFFQKIDVNATTSIDRVNHGTTSTVTYFDLSGREVKNPSNGLFIKAERMSDGTTRTSKVILK